MYDSRAKRQKLKPTDRRPVLNRAESSAAKSTDEISAKLPQTIDEMRKERNHHMQKTQQVLKPYVGKRTAMSMRDDFQQHPDTVSEQCDSAHPVAPRTSRTVAYLTDNCDVTNAGAQPVEIHSNSCTLNVEDGDKCVRNETNPHSSDPCRMSKEKLAQYLSAIG